MSGEDGVVCSPSNDRHCVSLRWRRASVQHFTTDTQQLSHRLSTCSLDTLCSAFACLFPGDSSTSNWIEITAAKQPKRHNGTFLSVLLCFVPSPVPAPAIISILPFASGRGGLILCLRGSVGVFLA